ncbi:unnamed protein product, partial [Mesorhabditis belari]|uniref:E3 ubiquitin-protein ligase n=1 Tax=Mesorhabditis belari TaxID=2138241 RepID=A0AAF3JBE3_9BILA
MKSTSKLGSMTFRKDPELTVSFYDGSILDTEVDAIVLSASKELRINEEIYKELIKRGNSSAIKNAFAVVRSVRPPGSIHGGAIIVVNVESCDLSWKNLLLAVEPDSFHVTMACKGLFDTVHDLGLTSIATIGFGCGSLKVDSKKAALKLKEAIKQQIEDGKLDKLKEIGIVDRSCSVIKDFMAVFELKVDIPEVKPNDDSSILDFITLDQVNDDVCVICLGELSDKSHFVVAIKKCNHMFHHNCFESYSNQTTLKRCPTCQVFFALPEGNMPRGSTMAHHVITNGGINLEGGRGYISIDYSVPSGIQEATHLRPGVPFHGTHRQAYLPNTPEGHKVLKLLEKAFECRLTFTVGDSITSGAQNVAVWNNIHHKTTLHGGSFGYPDADYLLRVTEELRAAGITEDMTNK